MNIDIHERDISSRVCQRCAACCRVYVTLENSDSRYRQFLRTTGIDVLPPAKKGQMDCCEDEHGITLDFGFCQHLQSSGDGNDVRFSCSIHNTKEFPKLCSQYNCVSWAKFSDCYTQDNELLVKAQEALNAVRKEDSMPPRIK